MGMKKISWIGVVIMMAGSLVFAGSSFAQDRNKDVGVVSYAKYEYPQQGWMTW